MHVLNIYLEICVVNNVLLNLKLGISPIYKYYIMYTIIFFSFTKGNFVISKYFTRYLKEFSLLYYKDTFCWCFLIFMLPDFNLKPYQVLLLFVAYIYQVSHTLHMFYIYRFPSHFQTYPSGILSCSQLSSLVIFIARETLRPNCFNRPRTRRAWTLNWQKRMPECA